MSITIIEKPTTVTFDEIHEILWEANKENREKGFVLKTSQMQGDELKKYLGNKGKCFLALDSNRIVGTFSVKIDVSNRWYAKGEIGKLLLLGILPSYQGQGIYTKLEKAAYDFLIAQECKIIEFETAESNKHVIDIHKRRGFILIDYYAPKGSDHYNVKMIKYLGKRIHSRVYCRLRFHVKKVYIRMRYKEGKVKRFGL